MSTEIPPLLALSPSSPPRPVVSSHIVYPESDGKPMAESSKQGHWIRLLLGNLAAIFRDRQDVFVSGDQFWYPVEGDNKTVQAPDVYVVFGRPKGHRGSYKQWIEGNVPMTVVFEVLSPSNTPFEMADKLAFYDDHGVEEYYLYDPEANALLVYIRGQAVLRLHRAVDGFVSPRLGIRFQMTSPEMTVFRPDGRPFLTLEELDAERERLERRADDEKRRADEAERDRARQVQRAEKAEERLARLERLAHLSRRVRLGTATGEELRELEQLEAQDAPPSQ